MSFQELKSLLIGVVLVCGVMFAGPLTSHASPADPFAVSSVKAGNLTTATAKLKRRAGAGERPGTTVVAPKVNQLSFDLSATAAKDFGDWEHERPL